MQKKQCIQLLTEVFRNVKVLMHQPYKELIYKNNHLKEKKNAGFHLFLACLLMTKILCFCLQSVNIFLR